MTDIIIVGAGSAARDYLQFIKDINKIKPTFNVKGFIADTGVDIKSLTNGEYTILGTIKDWKPTKNEKYIIGVAEPVVKIKLVQTLKNKGASFITLIHPTATINEYATIGKGCVISPYSKIGANAIVKNFVTVDGYIEHDNVIEDFVTLSTGTRLTGYVKVGFATFFGAMCSVRPHTTIGKNCFITIGTTVVTDIKDNSYVKSDYNYTIKQNKITTQMCGGGISEN